MNDQIQVQNRIPNTNYAVEQMQSSQISNALSWPYRTIMGLNQFRTVQHLQQFVSGIVTFPFTVLVGQNDIDQNVNCSRFSNFNSKLP